VYVTVLVTISRTWRTLGLVIRGDLISKCLPWFLLLKSQSKGERALRALNGDRTVDVVEALRGESTEHAGEGGIRIRPIRSVFGRGAEVGRIAGVGGISEVGDTDLWASQLHEQLLWSLDAVEGAVDGAEVGVDRPDSPPVMDGLVIDLRKSVYASGGVMGVLMPSSCLRKSA